MKTFCMMATMTERPRAVPNPKISPGYEARKFCESMRLLEIALDSASSNQELTTAVVMETLLLLEKLLCLTTAAVMSLRPNRVVVTVTGSSNVTLMDPKNPVS